MFTTQIKFTNIKPEEALKVYTEMRLEKVERLVEHMQDESICRVELALLTKHGSGEVFQAEIQVRVAGKDLRVVREREDLRAAIDEARDELLEEIKKMKEKNESLYRRGRRQMKGFFKRFYS
jgi:ribosomal subunit interface protein